jgi:hypothetical protein
MKTIKIIMVLVGFLIWFFVLFGGCNMTNNITKPDIEEIKITQYFNAGCLVTEGFYNGVKVYRNLEMININTEDSIKIKMYDDALMLLNKYKKIDLIFKNNQ